MRNYDFSNFFWRLNCIEFKEDYYALKNFRGEYTISHQINIYTSSVCSLLFEFLQNKLLFACFLAFIYLLLRLFAAAYSYLDLNIYYCVSSCLHFDLHRFKITFPLSISIFPLFLERSHLYANGPIHMWWWWCFNPIKKNFLDFFFSILYLFTKYIQAELLFKICYDNELLWHSIYTTLILLSFSLYLSISVYL